MPRRQYRPLSRLRFAGATVGHYYRSAAGRYADGPLPAVVHHEGKSYAMDSAWLRSLREDVPECEWDEHEVEVQLYRNAAEYDADALSEGRPRFAEIFITTCAGADVEVLPQPGEEEGEEAAAAARANALKSVRLSETPPAEEGSAADEGPGKNDESDEYANGEKEKTEIESAFDHDDFFGEPSGSEVAAENLSERAGEDVAESSAFGMGTPTSPAKEDDVGDDTGDDGEEEGALLADAKSADAKSEENLEKSDTDWVDLNVLPGGEKEGGQAVSTTRIVPWHLRVVTETDWPSREKCRDALSDCKWGG